MARPQRKAACQRLKLVNSPCVSQSKSNVRSRLKATRAAAAAAEKEHNRVSQGLNNKLRTLGNELATTRRQQRQSQAEAACAQRALRYGLTAIIAKCAALRESFAALAAQRAELVMMPQRIVAIASAVTAAMNTDALAQALAEEREMRR